MDIFCVVIIILNVCITIKIAIDYNKMVDENINLLEENLTLKLENLSYETTCDTLMNSNFNLMKENEIKKTKHCGRPRKTDK